MYNEKAMNKDLMYRFFFSFSFPHVIFVFWIVLSFKGKLHLAPSLSFFFLDIFIEYLHLVGCTCNIESVAFHTK